MRIGIFSDTYLPQINGVSTVVHILFEELRERGHEPLLFVPDYPNVDRLEDEMGGVYRFPSFLFPFHKESRVVLPLNRRALRRLPELEIIHSHTPFSLGLLAMWAAREFSIPHIHHYHTLFTEYRYYLPRPIRPSRWMAERVSAAFCNRCEAVLAPSRPMKAELEGYGIEKPVFALPFGVDEREFAQQIDWNARQALKIPEEEPLLLHSGRLAREKNLKFLLRAFREMLKEREDLWLVLTGGGPERPALERYVAELGIKDRVIFTGYLPREQLIELHREADLFIFTSKTETQGLVLVEAMAAGTPVVALGERGVLEVVQDGVNGLLPPEEEQSYAAVVLELLADRERLEEL
ncbi:MAG: glycosyltransferase family 4 protein, partial [Candidatus Bipolaricaulia bacterium]